MEKIWILHDNNRYTKKFRVIRKESDLLKMISSNTKLDILEYDLKSSIKASDYIKQKDRDIQLRSVLGELTSEEENIQNLIHLYDKLAPDGKIIKKWVTGRMVETTEKAQWLLELTKFSSSKKQISRILTNDKKYFLSVSNDKEWYKAVLKVHNFRDPSSIRRKWNSLKRKYDIIDDATDIIKENFKIAKQELRKNK